MNIKKHEYSQDRLNREIATLKFELDRMQMEHDKQRSAALVAEIVICIIMFFGGFVVGKFL